MEGNKHFVGGNFMGEITWFRCPNWFGLNFRNGSKESKVYVNSEFTGEKKTFQFFKTFFAQTRWDTK